MGLRRPRLITTALALAAAAPTAGCGRDSGATTTRPNVTSPPPRAVDSTPRLRELLGAAQRRDSRAVSQEDLSHRDPAVRRAAARALSHIADARATAALSASLHDADPEVVAWSAFGLGHTCEGREAEVVRRLVTRLASLHASAEAAPVLEPGAELDPFYALFDALARCGTPEAERTLSGFLERSTGLAELAARALGNLAARHQRLEDATVVALLDGAARSEAPLAHGLFAFTRLGRLEPSVKERLLEVAQAALGGTPLQQALAVRALGNLGDRGAAPLGEALGSGALPVNVRADAARQLARHGETGQRELAGRLPPLTQVDWAKLPARSETWTLVLAALRALTPGPHLPRSVLEPLTELGLPESAAIRHRVVLVRCQAASLLAGGASLAPRLVACDPDPNGTTGALATLEVLDRGPVTGARGTRWAGLWASTQPAVRAAALELLERHPELPRSHEVLAAALAVADPVVVLAAARVLARAPERAAEGGRPASAREPSGAAGMRPHPAVVQALGQALARVRDAAGPVELQATLIDAAAALELLSLKPELERACRDPNASLRQHAQRALRALGERERRCDEFEPGAARSELPAPAPKQPVELVFETELGELSLKLDFRFAPVAAGRLLELARSGFFAGKPVHRVVPGFVAQFGESRTGDAARPPLVSETSPLAFDTAALGLALSGPDTGSTQFFVTIGPYPHLDGEYPWLGRAGEGWDALVEGDVIQQVRVR